MNVERLVNMIMILLNKKRSGAQELAELFPYTIYREQLLLYYSFRFWRYVRMFSAALCTGENESSDQSEGFLSNFLQKRELRQN